MTEYKLPCCVFQVYIMVSSLLQCWWLYWSLHCWWEWCGLCTRGTLHVFGGFLRSAALTTDKPAPRPQSRMEMCWSQTWRHTQENSNRWLLFFFFFSFFKVSVVPPISVCISPFHHQVRVLHNTVKLWRWLLRTVVRWWRQTFLPLAWEGSQLLSTVFIYSDHFSETDVCEDVSWMTFWTNKVHIDENVEEGSFNVVKRDTGNLLFVIILQYEDLINYNWKTVFWKIIWIIKKDFTQ